MAKQDDCQKKIEMLIDDLASLETYIKELLVFFPAPLCFVSPLGVILEFNPAFEEMSGYNSREMIGKNINLVLEEEIGSLVERAVEDRGTIEREAFLEKKEGDKMPVTVFVRARRDEKGVPVGVFISIFDLSKVKETEKELRHKIEELEKFKEMAVGRELKMVELKEEIHSLKKWIAESEL